VNNIIDKYICKYVQVLQILGTWKVLWYVLCGWQSDRTHIGISDNQRTKKLFFQTFHAEIPGHPRSYLKHASQKWSHRSPVEQARIRQGWFPTVFNWFILTCSFNSCFFWVAYYFGVLVKQLPNIWDFMETKGGLSSQRPPPLFLFPLTFWESGV
jgi:hypothetical protein